MVIAYVTRENGPGRGARPIILSASDADHLRQQYLALYSVLEQVLGTIPPLRLVSSRALAHEAESALASLQIVKLPYSYYACRWTCILLLYSWLPFFGTFLPAEYSVLGPFSLIPETPAPRPHRGSSSPCPRRSAAAQSAGTAATPMHARRSELKYTQHGLLGAPRDRDLAGRRLRESRSPSRSLHGRPSSQGAHPRLLHWGITDASQDNGGNVESVVMQYFDNPASVGAAPSPPGRARRADDGAVSPKVHAGLERRHVLRRQRRLRRPHRNL